MAEQIEFVFTAPTLEERVRTDFELIRDALARADLAGDRAGVGDHPGVSGAVRREPLKSHGF
jgi:hypothetical protein